jgi:hypothetical protein
MYPISQGQLERTELSLRMAGCEKCTKCTMWMDKEYIKEIEGKNICDTCK